MLNRELELSNKIKNEINKASEKTQDVIEVIEFAKNSRVGSNLWYAWSAYLKENDKIIDKKNFKANHWRNYYDKEKEA